MARMNWARIVFVMAAMAFTSSVGGQEKMLPRKDLPAAVEKTVARESQGATIKGFSSESSPRARAGAWTTLRRGSALVAVMPAAHSGNCDDPSTLRRGSNSKRLLLHPW